MTTTPAGILAPTLENVAAHLADVIPAMRALGEAAQRHRLAPAPRRPADRPAWAAPYGPPPARRTR